MLVPSCISSVNRKSQLSLVEGCFTIVQDTPLLLEMVRHAPVRTAIFSVGPIVLGVIQVVNVYLHGGTLPLVVAFAAVMAAFSVLVTRYHAASFERMRLSMRFED